MDVASKTNPRIQSIKDRTGLGVTPTLPETTAEPLQTEEKPTKMEEKKSVKNTSQKKMMQILKILKTQGDKSNRELMELMGTSTSTIFYGAEGLRTLGAIDFIEDGKVRLYRFKSVPEGWNLSEVEEPNPFVKPKEEKDYSDNPLTALLSKKPTVLLEKIGGYQRFLDLTKDVKFIKEIDEVVTVLRDVCQQRILSATVECPLCHNKLGRDGSGVYCIKDRIKIDLGDSVASINYYLAHASDLKGMK